MLVEILEQVAPTQAQVDHLEQVALSQVDNLEQAAPTQVQVGHLDPRILIVTATILRAMITPKAITAKTIGDVEVDPLPQVARQHHQIRPELLRPRTAVMAAAAAIAVATIQ